MFCGACFPSDMFEARYGICFRARGCNQITTRASGLTRLRPRCETNMIICAVVHLPALPKLRPKQSFPPQNPGTTPRRLHGETMSTAVWHSDVRLVWSARWPKAGRVCLEDTP